MLKGLILRRPVIRRSFGSKSIQQHVESSAPTSTSTVTQLNAKGEAVGYAEQDFSNLPKTNLQNYTGRALNLYEFLKEGHEVEDIVDMRYKKYPYHLSHNNPQSPDYVASEFIDNQKKAEIDDYNRIIDDLKLNLELLKEYEEIRTRAVKRTREGAVMGNTANVFSTVRDYGTVGGDAGSFEDKQTAIHMTILDNLKSTINNSPFHRKYDKLSNMVAWEQELEDRPVNSHFHQLKGHKYDVEVPFEERAPHVADRLGHPEIFPTPFETLLRLERFDCHPGHLDQPFVQMPSAEPDKNLNFRPGEVIYENPTIIEWNKFWLTLHYSTTFFFCVWYPYAYFMKSSTPYSTIREDMKAPFYDMNYYNFDTYQFWPLFYLGFLGAYTFGQKVT